MDLEECASHMMAYGKDMPVFRETARRSLGLDHNEQRKDEG